MKTKVKSTLIIEIILVLFIASFVYRAIPNVNMLPSLPASENQIDDKEWGQITRMEFMKTKPPTSIPALKPIRPEKLWLQRPKEIGA